MSRKKRKGIQKGNPSENRDQTTHQAANHTAVIKANVPPSDGNQGDGKKKRHDAFEIAGLVVQIITLIVLGIYTGINYGLYDNSVESFYATQRADVSLGDENGKLAELRDGEAFKKPIVIVHFFNSGGTTARHFRALIYSSTRTPSSPSFNIMPVDETHRHRFKLLPSDGFPYGAIVETHGTLVTDVHGKTSNLELLQSEFAWLAKQPEGEQTVESSDITPKGRKLEYLTEDKWLLQRAELNDPHIGFSIEGWAEYCDIFGEYHCKGFHVRYLPGPVDDFVKSSEIRCVIERISPEAVHLPKDAVEISPCEQPNEH